MAQPWSRAGSALTAGSESKVKESQDVLAAAARPASMLRSGTATPTGEAVIAAGGRPASLTRGTAAALAAAAAVPPPAPPAALVPREQSYIPLALARRTIEAMERDMVAMKERHMAALDGVTAYYSRTEEETKRIVLSFLEQLKAKAREEIAGHRRVAAAAESELRELRDSSSQRISSLEARVASLEAELSTTLSKIATDSVSAEQQQEEVRAGSRGGGGGVDGFRVHAAAPLPLHRCAAGQRAEGGPRGAGGGAGNACSRQEGASPRKGGGDAGQVRRAGVRTR